MHNRIISIIALSMTLTVSNLHAGAGHNFHFDLPKTVSMSLDSYISSLLPDDQRVSKKYRDQFYALKTSMNIKKSVIIKKERLENGVMGSCLSLGFSPMSCSLIRFDEGKCNAYSDWAGSKIIAHELGHALHNHGGAVNSWKNIRDGMTHAVSLSGLYIIVSGNVRRGLGISLLSIITTIYAHQQNKALYAQYQENIRLIEREADQAGIPALAKCGYCSTLQDELNYTKLNLQKSFSEHCKSLSEDEAMRRALDERPCGEIYPTRAQMIQDLSQGLAECLQNTNIDPRTT